MNIHPPPPPINVLATALHTLLILFYPATFQTFIANTDADTEVHNAIVPPIEAEEIKVHPTKYHNAICLRLELYECSTGMSVISRSYACIFIVRWQTHNDKKFRIASYIINWLYINYIA